MTNRDYEKHSEEDGAGVSTNNKVETANNASDIQRCIFNGLHDIMEFLQTQSLQLQDAYFNMEDCLTISIGIKVSPAKEVGQYRIKSDVKFATGQVKFKKVRAIVPGQRELKL